MTNTKKYLPLPLPLDDWINKNFKLNNLSRKLMN